jgi:hypothetical protein
MRATSMLFGEGRLGSKNGLAIGEKSTEKSRVPSSGRSGEGSTRSAETEAVTLVPPIYECKGEADTSNSRKGFL